MIEKVKFSEYHRTAVVAEGLEVLQYKKDKCHLLTSYNYLGYFEQDLLFAVKAPVDGQYYLATTNTMYLDNYGYEYEGVKVLIFMLKSASESDYNELFPNRRFKDSFIMIDETTRIFLVFKK